MIFALKLEKNDDFHTLQKTPFYTNYRAKIACGNLSIMKSGTVRDKNQGSLNGIR